MEERQVSQSYREALLQISPTTEEKRRETGGTGESGRWKEREKKRGRQKKKRRWPKLKPSFINAVSIHYRCISWRTIRWVHNETECIINVWDYTEIFPNWFVFERSNIHKTTLHGLWNAAANSWVMSWQWNVNEVVCIPARTRKLSFPEVIRTDMFCLPPLFPLDLNIL